VLDASVAAKWWLPAPGEILKTEALQLFRDHAAGRFQIFAPDLLWPELANVLWKAVRAGRVTSATAREAIQSFADANITTLSSRPLMADAFDIAHAFGRSVYDGVYVALASSLDTPLVTADERLANALAARFPVRWLGAVL
jgi:predicted nucleic acid-binding protein